MTCHACWLKGDRERVRGCILGSKRGEKRGCKLGLGAGGLVLQWEGRGRRGRLQADEVVECGPRQRHLVMRRRLCLDRCRCRCRCTCHWKRIETRRPVARDQSGVRHRHRREPRAEGARFHAWCRCGRLHAHSRCRSGDGRLRRSCSGWCRRADGRCLRAPRRWEVTRTLR